MHLIVNLHLGARDTRNQRYKSMMHLFANFYLDALDVKIQRYFNG
jgi:hypothetical protein